MSIMVEISELVRLANLDRDVSNINRRTIKLLEEVGEVSEAWLNVTSLSNGKGKTWDDVREELADCLIVAYDVAWTKLPSETHVFLTPPGVSLITYDDLEKTIFDIAFHIGSYGQAINSGSYNIARMQIRRLTTLVEHLTGVNMPDQREMTLLENRQQLLIEVKRKLAKWANSQTKMSVITDDV